MPERTHSTGRAEVRRTDDGLVELVYHSDADPGLPALTAAMTDAEAIAHANRILDVARPQPIVPDTEARS